MIKQLALVLVAFSFLACSSGDNGAPPQDPATTEAPAQEEAANPDADTCVAECIESRQMQATSIEVIEAKCKEECAAAEEN